jgi:hypothetical protein
VSLSIDFIENISTSDLDEKTKRVIDIFVRSVNDWPSGVLNLDEFIIQLEEFISGIATKLSLETALTKPNIKNNAWKAEAITQVLEVYQYYDELLSLNDIINELNLIFNTLFPNP